MELAKVTIKLDRLIEVQRWNVTPAELMVLAYGHQENAGGSPIKTLELIGKMRKPRSATVEHQRLMNNYGILRHSDGASLVPTVKSLFGSNPKSLPTKFSELAGDDGRFFGHDVNKLPTTKNRGPKSYAPEHGGIPLDAELDVIGVDEDDVVDVNAPQQENGTEGGERMRDKDVLMETEGVNKLSGEYPKEYLPPPPKEEIREPAMTAPVALPQASEPSDPSPRRRR